MGAPGSGRRGAAQDEATTEAISENSAVYSDPEYRKLLAAVHKVNLLRRALGLDVPQDVDPEMYARQQIANIVCADAFRVMLAREKYIREQHRRAWKNLTRKELDRLVKSAEKSGWLKLDSAIRWQQIEVQRDVTTVPLTPAEKQELADGGEDESEF